MTRTEFIVDESLLPYLAKLAGEKPTPLSPWARIEPEEGVTVEGEKDVWAKMAAANLTDSSGQLKNEVMEAVSLLKDPTRFVRVRLLSGFSSMEHIFYSCGPDKKPVCLTGEGKEILVRYPAPGFVILKAIVEHWGSSILVSSNLNLKLDRETALVFAALVDMRRRRVLSDRAAMRTSQADINNPADILKVLEETPDDGQWLVAALKSFTGITGPYHHEKVDTALQQLVAKGVARRTEQGYRLSGEGLNFANRFLIISQVLRLDIIASPENETEGLVRSGMVCLQAGLHDNLYLDRKGDKVVMEAISAAFLKEMLQTFIAEQFEAKILDPMTELAQPPPEPEAAKTENVPAEPPPAAKTQHWYFLQEGKPQGPYSREQITVIIRDWQLKPEDLVWNETLTGWTRIGDLKELYPR